MLLIYAALPSSSLNPSSICINISLVTAGVSAAMNELRPCAPLSLKHVLAQELIKGLQAVSDSLLLYNTTRVLRANESGLFLSLCRAFIEVLYNLVTVFFRVTRSLFLIGGDMHLSINYFVLITFFWYYGGTGKFNSSSSPLVHANPCGFLNTSYWISANSIYRLLILIVLHVLGVAILVEQLLLWMQRTFMMESDA